MNDKIKWFIIALIILGVIATGVLFIGKNVNFSQKEKESTYNKNVLPRNVSAVPIIVTTDPKKVVRVYEDDVFKYESPYGFWVREGKDGPKHFHNPCGQKCPRREFFFYNMPKGGEKIYIYRDKNTSPGDFGLRFWIEQPG